jgi:hypothetical protein
MAQPTQYNRQNSFALYTAENPGEPHSGQTLDVEFNAVKVALDETQDNLELIQDDDGELARGSVGRPQLAADIVLGVAAPELWAADTEYFEDESVIFHNLILYIAAEDHTSAEPFDVTKWNELADFSATAAIEPGSIDTTQLADGAVTTAKIENLAVTTGKIDTAAVTPAKIALGLTRSFACTVGGTANAITLTPVTTDHGITALLDGMEFTFTPANTCTSTVTINVAGLGAKDLKAPDGYTYALWFDVQKNAPTRVRYSSTLDLFVLCNPPHSFKQSIVGHGNVKLQADGADSISLTQDDGAGLLVWNPTSASFRLIAMPSITNNDLFGASNWVEGVEDQALAADKLYAVYVFNPTGTNDQDVALDFYRCYTGVAAEAWTPTLNELGIYTKRSAIGETTPDNTRTYVGLVYTGGSDIEIALTGTTLQSFVCSHFKKWLFNAQADTVTVTGFTTASTELQATPIISIVTDGIDKVPVFKLYANVLNNTIDQLCSVYIQITGIAFDGSAFSATSNIAKCTSSTVNAWNQVAIEWGVAVPMGVFSAQAVVDVAGGTAQFELTMKCYFST